VTATVTPLPSSARMAPTGTGGGPDDPVILRLERLEEKFSGVDKRLSSIEVLLAEVKGELKQLPKATEIGEMKGRLLSMPTWWQMLAMIVSVFGGGAAIVFSVIRFSAK
jgi:hypothetical protein